MGPFFRLLDSLLNRIFSSRYNPAYASGSLALGLFAIVSVTGLYLVFVYQLGAPYESVKALQGNPWLGSWIRTVHRYASDLMVVAVILHILRLLAQGKHWGPRTWAWITGVGLLFLMLVSAWTGYVMVWDSQAQVVAVAGARIFDALGLFPDPILRSFNGIENAPSSFFFLNLFLHVVIPLAMIFAVWVHTSRIARADWLPDVRVMLGLSGALIAGAVLWPAPLGPAADLLALPADVPLDAFYHFWVPWAETHPLTVFWGFLTFAAGLSAVPFLTKPKIKPPVSNNDPNICQGCTQCVQDCPYEAIQMVTLEVKSRPKLVAQVSPELCVSCGICSASCEPMTIGPEGRKAGNQIRNARFFLGQLKEEDFTGTLIMSCRRQPEIIRRLKTAGVAGERTCAYSVDCPGTIHSAVYDLMARKFSRVVIASCPERNCTNKDGLQLLSERLSGAREPSHRVQSGRNKIWLRQVGEGEVTEFLRSLHATAGEITSGRRRWGRRIKAFAASLTVVFTVSLMNGGAASFSSPSGILRLSVRLVGQSEKKCRSPGVDETAKLPLHMRATEICETRPLNYFLRAKIDGRTVLEEEVQPGGFKKDRPIYVNREVEVAPGERRIDVSLSPVDPGESSVLDLHLSESLHFTASKIVLIHYDPGLRSLKIKGAEHE